jgi:hypothetical protein
MGPVSTEARERHDGVVAAHAERRLHRDAVRQGSGTVEQLRVGSRHRRRRGHDPPFTPQGVLGIREERIVGSARQLDVLRRLDCDQVQGFHLGRPTSPDLLPVGQPSTAGR